MFSDKKLSSRNGFLAVGVFAMLFSGILYAWSILKVPFKSEFGFSDSSLALAFTFTMSFFCIGGLLGAQLSRRAGHRIALITAGVLSALGFALTAFLHNASVAIYELQDSATHQASCAMPPPFEIRYVS